MVNTADLYNNPRRLIVGDSEYNHAFGGPFNALGREVGPVPFHLLFDLDLRDPLLMFLKLNGDRLPFIFPLCYDGADIAYKVTPNGAIEFLGKKKLVYAKDWPYPNYPKYFERVPVSIVPLSYEEHRAAVFRYAIGSEKWLREDDQDLIRSIGSKFTQLGGVQELPFGEPQPLYCPDPACYWHQNCCSMTPLASIWNSPIPGVNLWGDDADVLIVYFMCNDCGAIYACSMCD